MRVKDLPEDQVCIGLRVKSICSPKVGTVVACNERGDETTYFIKWDGENKIGSGFFAWDCECEIVER